MAESTPADPNSSAADVLVFEPIAGPSIRPIEASPARPVQLGRSSVCQAVLLDEGVSRRHAVVECAPGGGWTLKDLGSRHGTFLNGVQLDAEVAAPLHPDDTVAIGPWTFRVTLKPQGRGAIGKPTLPPTAMNTPTGGEERGGGGASGGAARFTRSLLGSETAGKAGEAAAGASGRVERVSERELAAITQTRLTILMNTAAAIAGVTDEHSLAGVILRAAVEGSGFPRATLLRDAPSPAQQAGELEVLGDVLDAGSSIDAAHSTPNADVSAEAGQGWRGSRSLIAAARGGEVARLTADAPMNTAASIVQLGIQTALCAPVFIGSKVAAYLYLDARTSDTGTTFATAKIRSDAAAFCQAIARMCGMAMSNLNRVELERRQRELMVELQAAKEAQRLILPPEQGAIGGVSYAVRVRSGRFVAGDLFDVVPLKDGKVGVFLGDVSGKGVGAAVLMAAAQTHLNVSLRDTGCPVRALIDVNKFVAAHTDSNKFITLWLGVFDPAAGKLQFIDAGHGHWLMRPAEPGAAPRPVESAGGIPLGIEPCFEYTPETIDFPAGSRIVLFSDGVVEQPSPAGVHFAIERTIEALSPSTTPADDVELLFEAVFRFAQTDSLSDDTTVASIMVR